MVQRFGDEVAGGAEALCRATAHALADRGDEVEVYTTTARDYLTWAPHYRAGTQADGAVTVHRFTADRPDPARSAELTRGLSLGVGDGAAELAWARAQGPIAPGMLRALSRARERHEAVALWTYLYATTQLAMPLAPERTVLVPLAHDEPMLRFGLSRGLVRMARGLAFMTPEERRLVDDLHGVEGHEQADRGRRPGAGAPRRGRARPGGPRPAGALRALPRPPRPRQGPRRPGAGPRALPGRRRPARPGAGGASHRGRCACPSGCAPRGSWTAATRSDLLDAAEVVVLPSPHESLSLVALEAWRAGRPTLAIAHSEVLAGQTARSGGGLLYLDAPTYGRQLLRLGGDPGLRARLGAAGHAWTAGHTWDACAAPVERPAPAGARPAQPDADDAGRPLPLAQGRPGQHQAREPSGGGDPAAHLRRRRRAAVEPGARWPRGSWRSRPRAGRSAP